MPRDKGTYADPNDVVRVGWIAGATGILLITGRADQDGVLNSS